MMSWRAVAALLWTAAFLSCATSGGPHPPKAEGARPPLTVVTLCDLHGQVLPKVRKTPQGEAVEVGGARWLGAYLRRIRESAPGPVLVVDAGDLFQGTLESNLGEGAAVVALYNHLGVDAAALGNHEFDYGPEGARVLPESPEDDPRGALKARIREARFPILACNVVEQATGRRPAWLRASVTVERGGVRVGVVGAAGVDTPTTTLTANLVGLRFEDPVACIAREARRLRQEGAQWVVAVVHIGASCDDSTEEGTEGCTDSGLLALARRLPKGSVDLLAGGHTHRRVVRFVEGVPVLEAWARGVALGVAELPAGPGAARIEVVETCGAVVADAAGRVGCDPSLVRRAASGPKPARFRGRVLEPDRAAEASVAPWVERVRALKARPLGVTATAEVWGAYADESPLGNLVAAMLRRAVPGADVGMTNGGGLRAPLPAGPLTYGHVYEALPFDNRLAVLRLRGADLRRIVELGLAGGHGGLSWDGLTFEAEGCTLGRVWVHGAPLDTRLSVEALGLDYTPLARALDAFDVWARRLRIIPASKEISHVPPH